MTRAVHTVGHSTHSWDAFLELLVRHDIDAIADVRSRPHSHRNPQFERAALERALPQVGIQYVFLGEELGARPRENTCYEGGRVRYDFLARTHQFQRGLERIRSGAADNNIALMCAEADPISCHRSILITRHLVNLGVSVQHILKDGSKETHDQLMDRLRTRLRLPDEDLLRSRSDIVDEAYKLQEAKIAFSISSASAGAKS